VVVGEVAVKPGGPVRAKNGSFFVVAAFVVAVAAVSTAADGPVILTSPLGLVNGELEVEVDLGGSMEPATLYLNGVDACTPTSASPKCVVDLGLDLHVHLLELILSETNGPVQLAERWFNRPGHEAELEIELATRPVGDVCGGRLNWFDTHGLQPAVLEAEAAGERMVVSAESRTFGYRCAAVGETEVVSAAVVFPDGRRATSVALTGDTGRSFGKGPQPIVLEPLLDGGEPCASVQSSSGETTRRAEREGFEVAFVLDPTADYGALAGLGVRSGTGQTGDGESISAWQRATTAVSDADRLWFVRPDTSLLRVDGFSQGRESWLGQLLQIGSNRASDEIRLSDAVATAGLVAGAGPRRRVVALVLGSGSGGDASRFSARLVRSYLAEVGVPLLVIRTQNATDDGWPRGVDARSLDELADAFEMIRDRIDEQCVAWFPVHLEPQQIAAMLPGDSAVAGRRDTVAGAAQTVWRRAAVAGTVSDIQPISDEPVARGKVEVTAVEILVRALDGEGRPVTDLSAGDLRVAEDGQLVPVLDLEAVRPLAAVDDPPSSVTESADSVEELPRKIVPVSVYVERRLAGTQDIVPAIHALTEQVEWLTALGPVDVMVADRMVETVLEGETDPEVVRSALDAVASRRFHGHAIERIRANYVTQIALYPDRGNPRLPEEEPDDPATGTPDNALRVKTMTAARTAIFEEDALLRATVARMNDWALSLQNIGPRLLFLVGTGFDEDPIDFYVSFIEQNDPALGTAARAEFIRYNQAARVDSVGRELAAAGWMVVPVAIRVTGRQRSAAEFSGRETFQSFLTDQGEGGYIGDVEFMLLDPIGSQQHLAGPSGGKVVMGGSGLDKLIDESTGWFRLTYQVARAPDGALHEVTVTSERPGVKVENTGLVVSGTSEGRAAMRSRRLLDDPAAAGELSVRLAVSEPRQTDGKKLEATLSASVDLGPIAPLFTAQGNRALRYSIAVRSGPGEPFVHHEVATAVGAVGGMQYDVPIQWSGRNAELAVVVEDLGSGAWGGTVIPLTN
jgi:hypothetical protein